MVRPGTELWMWVSIRRLRGLLNQPSVWVSIRSCADYSTSQRGWVFDTGGCADYSTNPDMRF